jgi:alkylglycerol monooxygenase
MWYKIDDVYHFKKYTTTESKPLLIWIWIQLVVLLLLVSYLFANIALIGMPGIFLYGAFVFLYVYAFSELMDGNKFALLWEIIKSTSAISLVFFMGDWFGSDKFSVLISYVLIGYFATSILATLWIVQQKNKLEKQNEITA